MHTLELAKTAWNACATAQDDEVFAKMISLTKNFLRMAEDILTVLGPEGDDKGPLQEIHTLRSLIANSG